MYDRLDIHALGFRLFLQLGLFIMVGAFWRWNDCWRWSAVAQELVSRLNLVGR